MHRRQARRPGHGLFELRRQFQHRRLITETSGAAIRRDGNSVQLDREMLNMTRAAGDFSAAQTALAAKFRLVRYAINEGR